MKLQILELLPHQYISGGQAPPARVAVAETWNGSKSWTEVSDLNTARGLI